LLGLGIAAKAAAIGIGIVQGALAFIPAIAAIFASLMGPAGLMIIGLGAVTAAWLAWTESGQSASAKMGEAMDNQKAIFGETIDGIKTALANGDYGAAVDVLMAGLSASWSQGLADLLSMTGGFAKGVLEVFVGIASGVSEVWVNMQAGIAKKLLDWASQEGFVGEQMRAFLGVDPREKTAQGKMTQQQRAGLSEQVRVWESALGRVGASGTVESGEFAGTAKADLEQWISGALAKMQMENAGLTPEQLAVQGAADAPAEIDRQNAEQRAGIDATLGGTLTAFDKWSATAQERADAARSRLGEVTAEPEFDADQAMNDWFDQREAEDAAIAEMTAAAGGGDVPVSLKGGGVSGTFSAAAAMALGGGVGTPEAQTAGYTKAMLAELRKMIGRQDATLEELKKWGFIV